MGSRSLYSRRIKRPIDLVVSLIGLVVLAAPMAALALAIRITMGKPALFRQERPGLHGEPFALVKFRTMRPPDPDARSDADKTRITPFGAWLRKTSLDELPELWNVLKGEMSLVGPRPLLMEYLPLYSARQLRRHHVRAGITGLAQVSGRNALDWDSKFELDLEYVDKVSFRLDAWILFRTLLHVLRRTGVDAAGEETMPRFAGPDTAR